MTHGRPAAAQRDAELKLEVRRRMREIEQSILARAPEHDLELSLDYSCTMGMYSGRITVIKPPEPTS